MSSTKFNKCEIAGVYVEPSLLDSLFNIILRLTEILKVIMPDVGIVHYPLFLIKIVHVHVHYLR